MGTSNTIWAYIFCCCLVWFFINSLFQVILKLFSLSLLDCFKELSGLLQIMVASSKMCAINVS